MKSVCLLNQPISSHSNQWHNTTCAFRQDGVYYKGNQGSNTIQVFTTSNHDTTMINSEIVELTEEQLDALMQSNFNSPYEDDVDTELHSDCYGDDYANEVINSIGFFRAHYGEV